jgi:hypothetical protein
VLIDSHVVHLSVHYKDHIRTICEFVSEVLAWQRSQGLTELWVEQYDKPERQIGITPLKNGLIGQMVWVPDIEGFTEVLAFLRSREVNCFRVPGESTGCIEGISFQADDFSKLDQLAQILRRR